MPEGICEYLEWDSNFFGVRIARMAGHALTADHAQAVGQWCAAQRIDCLYFLARSDDALTTDVARERGYQLVDIRVTFERERFDDNIVTPDIRPFVASDRPALRQIARTSHNDSRFYYDSRFPRARCDELYEAWIERSCDGWADAVLVAEHEGRLCGYISCHLTPSGAGSIGLVAVAADARGQGLGSRLVYAALNYFSSKGASRATVVTQGRNIQSQRLYQRCGFLTQSVQLWYHRWFQPGPTA